MRTFPGLKNKNRRCTGFERRFALNHMWNHLSMLFLALIGWLAVTNNAAALPPVTWPVGCSVLDNGVKVTFTGSCTEVFKQQYLMNRNSGNPRCTNIVGGECGSAAVLNEETSAAAVPLVEPGASPPNETPATDAETSSTEGETNADPVLLSSGALLLQRTDVSMPGPRNPLKFKRTYISTSDFRGALGSNWTHNFERRIIPFRALAATGFPPSCKTADKCVLVDDGEAGTHLFVWSEDLAAFIHADSTDVLFKRSTSRWELVSAHGDTYTFGEHGELLSFRDRFGEGYDVVENTPTPPFTMYQRYCSTSGRNSFRNEDPRLCDLLGAALSYTTPAMQVTWRISSDPNDGVYVAPTGSTVECTYPEPDPTDEVCTLPPHKCPDPVDEPPPPDPRPDSCSLPEWDQFTGRKPGLFQGQLDAIEEKVLYYTNDEMPDSLVYSRQTLADHYYLDPRYATTLRRRSHWSPETRIKVGYEKVAFPKDGNPYYQVYREYIRDAVERALVSTEHLTGELRPNNPSSTGLPVSFQYSPQFPTGDRRMVPKRIVDTTGRELKIEYFESRDPQATRADFTTLGLLRRIHAPNGTTIEFTYTRPTPTQEPATVAMLHETLLVSVKRTDAPDRNAFPSIRLATDIHGNELAVSAEHYGYASAADVDIEPGFTPALFNGLRNYSSMVDNITGVYRHDGADEIIEVKSYYDRETDRVVLQRYGDKIKEEPTDSEKRFVLMDDPVLPDALLSRYPVRYYEDGIGGFSHGAGLKRSNMSCDWLDEVTASMVRGNTRQDLRKLRDWQSQRENEICQWVLTVDQDGYGAYHGLNYRGSSLVKAHVLRLSLYWRTAHDTRGQTVSDAASAHGLVFEERRYDPDGIAVILPTEQGQASEWFIDEGGTKFIRQSLRYFNYNLSAWRSRQNVVRTEQYPQGSQYLSLENNGFQQRSILVRTNYEPVFNQPTKIEEGARGSDNNIYIYRETIYSFNQSNEVCALPNDVGVKRCAEPAPTRIQTRHPNHTNTERAVTLKWSPTWKLQRITENYGGRVTTFAYDEIGFVRSVSTSRFNSRYFEGIDLDLARCSNWAAPYQYANSGNCSLPTWLGSDVALAMRYNAIDTISTWRNALGHVIKVERAADKAVTEVIRDNYGRALLTTYPDGSATEQRFDRDGRVVLTEERGRGGERGQRVRLYYDDSGRQVAKCREIEEGGCDSFDVPAGGVTDTWINQLSIGMGPNVGDPVRQITVRRVTREGRLRDTLDVVGRRTSYSYNKRGQLLRVYGQSVTGDTKRAAYYCYDLQGRQTHTFEGDPNVTLGKWREICHQGQEPPTCPGGPDKAYRLGQTEYDVLGRVVALHEDGLTSRYTYNRRGLVTSTETGNRQCGEDGNGPVLTSNLSYDEHGQVVRIDDGQGSWQAYEWGRLGRSVRVKGSGMGNGSTLKILDGAGNLLWVRNAVGDERIMMKFDRLRNELLLSIEGSHIRRQRTHYDVFGRFRFREALGFDGDGIKSDHRFSVDRDGLGRVINTEVRGGVRTSVTHQTINGWQTHVCTGDDPARCAEFTYNSAGEVIAVVDPKGERTTFEYDHLGRQTTVDAQAAGVREEWEYDAIGRLTSHIRVGTSTLKYHYDGGGRLEQVDRLVDGFARPFSRLMYDALGRPLEAKHWPEALNGDWTVETWSYARDGRLATESVRLPAALIGGADVVRGVGSWTAWLNRDTPRHSGDWERLRKFVEKGQVCERPEGVECRRRSDGTQWFETGDVMSCTREEGAICRNSLQSDGKCDDYEVRFFCPSETASTDVEPDASLGSWTEWLNRDTPSLSGDWERLRKFVEKGQVCEQPEGVECRRRSDGTQWFETGDVMSCTREEGAICRNSLQSDGKCDDYEVRFFCAPKTSFTEVTHMWSRNSLSLWEEKVELPFSHEERRSWDPVGRRVSQNRGAAGVQQNISYNWRGAQSIGWFQGDISLRQQVTHDGLGRPKSKTASAFTYATMDHEPLYRANVHRDRAGRITSLDWIHGASSSRKKWRGYEYDDAGWLAAEFRSDQQNDTLDEALAAIHNLDYLSPAELRDRFGHLLGVKYVTHERDSLIGSLNAVRLSKAPQAEWAHIGERLEGHRLKEVRVDAKTLSVVYDGAGRIEKVGDLSLGYDAQGQLAHAIKNGVREDYIYGATGRLLGVTRSDETLEGFVYEGDQKVAAYDENRKLLWHAMWGPGIDNLVRWTDARTDRSWGLVSDLRYNVVAAANVRKERSGGVDYNTFGVVENFANCATEPRDECAGPVAGMPFGFASAWRSSGTGLIHMRERWYSPALGEFLTRDPLGYVDAYNAYMYVGGDPVNGWDPLGMSKNGGFAGWLSAHMPGPESLLDSALDAVKDLMSGGFNPGYDLNALLRDTWSLGVGVANTIAPVVEEAAAGVGDYFKGSGESVAATVGKTVVQAVVEIVRPSEEEMALVGTGIGAAVADGPLPFGEVYLSSTVGYVVVKHLKKAPGVVKKGYRRLKALAAKGIDNSVIGKPRVGSANKTDPTHRFNDIIDNYAGDATKFNIPTKGPGGQVVRTSELRQIEGGLNGRDGVFEWVIDQGNVTHRRFIPGGKVTGFPNQVPKK